MILQTFRFRSACLSLCSQTTCSATLPEIGICGSEFKGTTLGRWDVKTLCNTDSCLRHVAAARLSPSPLFIYFRHSLVLRAPLSDKKQYHWHAGGRLPLGSNQAITNGRRMEGLLFCFCSSLFQRDIEFLALCCTSGRTIIAFSSLGSSLFSI